MEKNVRRRWVATSPTRSLAWRIAELGGSVTRQIWSLNRYVAYVPLEIGVRTGKMVVAAQFACNVGSIR